MQRIVRQDHPCRLLRLPLQQPVWLLRVLSRQLARRAPLWRRASRTPRRLEASSPVVRPPLLPVQDRTTQTLPESCLACHSTIVTLPLSVSRHRRHRNQAAVQESLNEENESAIVVEISISSYLLHRNRAAESELCRHWSASWSPWVMLWMQWTMPTS